MRKRIFSRVLALFLVLSMLSTTAFAASFADFQKAIDGNSGGTLIAGTEDHYGYGTRLDSGGYEITAWNVAASGETPANRVVNLNADVNFTEGDKGIVIDGNKSGQQNVTINMNGHTIDMNPDVILDAKADDYGKFYLAEKDENGNKVAKLDEYEDPIEANEESLNAQEHLLEVKRKANVTINGDGGTITGGNSVIWKTYYVNDDDWGTYEEFGPCMVGGGYGRAAGLYFGAGSNVLLNSVNIDGNRSGGDGAGIYIVGNNYTPAGSFEMKGGSLTNNYSNEGGGGLLGYGNNLNVILNGVNVANNVAEVSGGGICLTSSDNSSAKSTVTFKGCKIQDNISHFTGGGIYAKATCNIDNTQIMRNYASTAGGGIFSPWVLNLQEKNLITQNVSSGSGGGICVAMGESTLGNRYLNVTGEGNEIYQNNASKSGDDLDLDPVYVIVSGGERLNKGELKDSDGHTLRGWYVDSESKPWSERNVTTKATNLTGGVKYAHNKYYDIKKDLNDGSEDAVSKLAEMELDLGTYDASNLVNPTRTGYTFQGWSVVGGKGNDLSELSSRWGDDVILKAQWKINNYQADFTDTEGGTTTPSQNADYNTKFTKPADPKRTGYTFAGWTLNGSDYDFDTPATDNITLTAKWNINNYQADFTDTEGGTTTPSQNADYNTKFSKPADPERTGYTFAGWTLNGSDYNFDTPATDNITLMAKWNINHYTATFTDPEGGNGSTTTEAEYNSPFSSPENNPTRNGYTFAGWTLDGKPFDFKNSQATGDITLVATWTPVDDNDDGNTGDTILDAGIPLGDLPAVMAADAATTTIEDEETPLAGLFTRADAIGYLWEQTGSPEAELSDFEDVPEDHYWAVAIGWAQDMGIALPDEEGNFRPDDMVLRSSNEPEGELQEFLNRYAVFAGVDLENGELFIELDGAADDIIMGEEAQVIFDQFFAKLEAALAKQAA